MNKEAELDVGWDYEIFQCSEVILLPVMVDNMCIEFQQPKCKCRGRRCETSATRSLDLWLGWRVQRDIAAANFGASFPFDPSISQLSLWHWILLTINDELVDHLSLVSLPPILIRLGCHPGPHWEAPGFRWSTPLVNSNLMGHLGKSVGQRWFLVGGWMGIWKSDLFLWLHRLWKHE